MERLRSAQRYAARRMPVLGRPPDATVSRIVSKKGAAVGATGARADVRWEVGGFARTNPGESVSATVHTGPKGAPQEWDLVFYPRGFVDPASVSVFITNVGCREQKAPPTDADITATVMVCAIPAAEDGSRKAGSSKKEGKAGKKGATACRKFSRTFSSNAHTFGFEQFTDWSVLFGKGSPFLHSGGAGGGDSLMLQVVINVCVAPPLSPVEVDHTVRDSGWQRVSWPLRDFKGLIENTPAACRLSSPIFYLNGDWYLDLYPAGYRLDEDDREARRAEGGEVPGGHRSRVACGRRPPLVDAAPAFLTHCWPIARRFRFPNQLICGVDRCL